MTHDLDDGRIESAVEAQLPTRQTVSNGYKQP